MNIIFLLFSLSCNYCGFTKSSNPILTQKEFTSVCSYLKIPSSQKSHIWEIIKKESNFKKTATNPKSSAYGLTGFVKRTRTLHRVPKNDCASCQIKGLMSYTASRYGSPRDARAFHRRNGYY
jgi:hypothetical protein